MSNKKGISEIISYVLLIVIAVGLSVLVFSFLKLYIPKFQTPECPKDISLIVSEVACNLYPDATKNALNLTLVNKGLFNVTGKYIRFGAEQREVLSLVNKVVKLRYPLAPGETIKLNYFLLPEHLNWKDSLASKHTLEIEPAVENEKGELALCDNAVITQKITCE